MTWYVALIIILVMVLLISTSFVVSAAETAFIASSFPKIEDLAEKGNKKAARVKKLLERPNQFLSTIQVVNTLIAFINGALGSNMFTKPILNSWFGVYNTNSHWGLYVAITTVILTLFFAYWQIIFGELVAKRVGMKNPEKMSMFFSGFIMGVYYVMFPIVWFLTASTGFFARFFGVKPGDEIRDVTEEEIRVMVAAGTQKGGIDEDEGEMIDNIFEFDDTMVSEIMTHRTEILGILVTITQEELLDKAVNERYTRYPVYEDSIDNIIGIIHVKDLLKNLVNKEDFNLRELTREPYFVPESKKINDLFKEMQQDKIHIAIVIDEYGGTAGLVTIEDVIEEIVGDIDDEYDDDEKEIQELTENQYEIEGLSDIQDVEDVLQCGLPVDDYDTLSGFMIGLLERLPEDDEKISLVYNDVKFESLEVHDMIIGKVLVTKLNPTASKELEEDENE